MKSKYYFFLILFLIHLDVTAQIDIGSNSNNNMDSIVKSEDCLIFVPNAFSPNEHHGSRVFDYAISCEVTEFEINIFNTYGELIFHSKKQSKYWDGRGNKEGIYLYHIKLRYPKSDLIKYTGEVYLLQ